MTTDPFALSPIITNCPNQMLTITWPPDSPGQAGTYQVSGHLIHQWVQSQNETTAALQMMRGLLEDARTGADDTPHHPATEPTPGQMIALFLSWPAVARIKFMELHAECAHIARTCQFDADHQSQLDRYQAAENRHTAALQEIATGRFGAPGRGATTAAVHIARRALGQPS